MSIWSRIYKDGGEGGDTDSDGDKESCTFQLLLAQKKTKQELELNR